MTVQQQKERMNVSVDHSEPGFFSDNVAVSHTPMKFVVDFAQVTPRFDSVAGQRQQSLAIKHKTIILDPQVAKDFLNVLKENLGKYEKNFGAIKVPKPAKQSAKSEKSVISEADASSRYIG